MKKWKEVSNWKGESLNRDTQRFNIESDSLSIMASVGSYLASQGVLWLFSIYVKYSDDELIHSFNQQLFLTQAEAKQKANAIIDEIIAQNT